MLTLCSGQFLLMFLETTEFISSAWSSVFEEASFQCSLSFPDVAFCASLLAISPTGNIVDRTGHRPVWVPADP